MLFDFTDANRREAVTDIERYGNLIVATELKENPGMSVTNASEYIATQYARQHGMQLGSVVFVERYDDRSYSGGSETPNYSLVTFSPGERNGEPHLTAPNWKHLTESEYNALIEKETA